MNNLILTQSGAVGPCGECGYVTDHTYQLSVFGCTILLCGRCIETFAAQITSLLQKEKAPVEARAVTLNAGFASDLRCSRCLDLLAERLRAYHIK